MQSFKNADDAVFGIILCLAGVLGVLLLMVTLYYLFKVGNYFITPNYPTTISCLVFFIVAVSVVRWQLRSGLIAWWSYVALIGACIWAFFVCFSLPLHDVLHLFLGIEGCDESDVYHVAALVPLGILALTAFSATIHWLVSFPSVRKAGHSIKHWLTTYE